jgi:hypothetical protein
MLVLLPSFYLQRFFMPSAVSLLAALHGMLRACPLNRFSAGGRGARHDVKLNHDIWVV